MHVEDGQDLEPTPEKQKLLQGNVFYAKIAQKSGSHLKILDARRVTGSKSYAEDQQILVATAQM
jgi:hypothetical protein